MDLGRGENRPVLTAKLTPRKAAGRSSAHGPLAMYQTYELYLLDAGQGPPRFEPHTCRTPVQVLQKARELLETDVQLMAVEVRFAGEHLFTLALLQIASDRWFFYHRCHRLICDEPSLEMTFRTPFLPPFTDRAGDRKCRATRKRRAASELTCMGGR